ncbi:MAG: alpha/beta hydrolase [Actinobacteria bacterium]|nr:alpha/beta hydrolase [Actinomycetota bacterium]
MRAGLPLGEAIFDELGYSVLAPSRPGYGKTPLHPDSSPEGFAKTTAELCAQVGVQRVAAVLAMSAGGRTGLAMAANYPHLVPRLILEGAVGFEPWPTRGRTSAPRSSSIRPGNGWSEGHEIAFTPVFRRERGQEVVESSRLSGLGGQRPNAGQQVDRGPVAAVLLRSMWAAARP